LKHKNSKLSQLKVIHILGFLWSSRRGAVGSEP